MNESPLNSGPAVFLKVCLAVTLVVLSVGRFSQAGGLVFTDGLESGHPCGWSVVRPVLGCPPEFGGLSLAAATGREQITLGWLPAVDDTTPPEEILYRVYLGNCQEPSALITTVQGGTSLVLDGLDASTTYCVEVVAEDEDGQTSDGGARTSEPEGGISVTTLTLEQIASSTVLQTTESLNLGPPQVGPTTLVFAKGPISISPDVGAVLVGPASSSAEDPVGFIRFVEGVAVTTNEIIVETSEASVEATMDQFELATASLPAMVGFGQALAQKDLADAWRTELSSSYSGPLVWSTTHRYDGRVGAFEVSSLDQVDRYRIVSRSDDRRAKGFELGDDLTFDLTLEFEPELRTSASWDLGGVHEAEIFAIGTLTMDALAEYHFSASASYEPEDLHLYTTSWVSVYLVGSVPVYQKVTMTLDAQVSATASAEVTAMANATAEAALEIGARYTQGGGWETIVAPGFESGLSADLSVVGGVTAEIRLIPTVSVEFYEALAASISVEPSISTTIEAEGTLLTPCFPVQLTAFDTDIEVEANLGVDFTLLGSYVLFDATVWDPDPWMVFSLPEVQVETSGSGAVELTVDITEGANNDFVPDSAQWWIDQGAGVELVQNPADPLAATLQCDDAGTYDVVFSGYGALGEPGRRCSLVSVECSTTPEIISITLPGEIQMDLVHIPAGVFQMGSPVDERDRRDWEDLHEVTLTQGYYVGVTEVTQAQWEAVTGLPMPTSCGNYGVGPNFPVYCVSWNDIAGVGGFVEELNLYLTLTGQPGAGLFRLPSDAEWERAARAGNQYRFSHGDVLECDDACGFCTVHDDFMWWCGNEIGQAVPVASKLGNDFGLHDVHGNLSEWVEDWWEFHLGAEPQTDPTGPISGVDHVTRGGGWDSNASFCRSAARGASSPNYRGYYIGFRLARSE